MKPPLSFNPRYIGKLVALRDAQQHGSPVWLLLCALVDAMREFKDAARDAKHYIFGSIEIMFGELAGLGVGVGL